jgi:L-asparaginase / beta-aspartyl-peptidase
MKNLFVIFLFLGLQNCQNPTVKVEKKLENAEKRPEYAIAIHGGAGTILKIEMTPEKQAAYEKALNDALSEGENVLKNGGNALDAVTASVVFLENCPLFNAGRGAVFNFEGKNELDAAIMDGSNQMAGAVGGVQTIKNPVKLARAVMEKSPHVLLTGRGAEQFGVENGIETAKPDWFFTQERYDYWQKMKAETAEKPIKPVKSSNIMQNDHRWKFGTVGCVALDKNGHLAAATSTGGMTNKRWHRIGDAPIIGAGTYADDATVAVSCTGHGEFFIRYAVAHDLAARIEYGGHSLAQACDDLVMKKLVEKGGEGGLIAVDKMGNICLPFNSEGMYRGWAKPGERKILIFKE